MRKSNKGEFIEKANIVHNNLYDYSKFIYIGSLIKGIVICPTHGEFLQSPGSHLEGYGCRHCAHDKNRSNKEEFVKKANIIHNSFYNYLKINYVNNHKKIEIICSIHGSFSKNPNSHLQGHGCPYCTYDKKRSNKKEFIEKANIVHNNFYNYSKIEYKNALTIVIITCPIHGDFGQTPGSHLQGHRCPFCGGKNISKEEIKFINFLKEKNNSEYKLVSQKDEEYPNNIKNIRKQLKRCYRPDLLLKKGSEYIVVEYNGDFWHKGNGNDIHPICKTSVKEIIKKDKKRIKDFNLIGIAVISIYSSEWKGFIKNSEITKNIKKLFKILKINIEEK